jgi:uncharacterized protein YutE (UPF0331/DUF86 family)
MLLKAGLLSRGGSIRAKGEDKTITFDDCLRRAPSNGSLKFIDDDQALLLTALNGHRNAAAHHLLTISEEVLYIETQSAITVFRDVLRDLFAMKLEDHLPSRVLPLSTIPPANPTIVFRDEVEAIRKLLAPGMRRRTEAESRIRAIAIFENSLLGEPAQPSQATLKRLLKKLGAGERFDALFPGVAAVSFVSAQQDAHITLRFNKREGLDVRYVAEGEEGVGAIHMRKVHDSDFYTLSHKDLCQRLGLTTNQVSTAIRILNVKANDELSREMIKNNFRYNENVLGLIRELYSNASPEQIKAKISG